VVSLQDKTNSSTVLTDTDPAAVLIDEGDNASQVLLDAANILGADAPRTIES
jgi:hypothetical protein